MATTCCSLPASLYSRPTVVTITRAGVSIPAVAAAVLTAGLLISAAPQSVTNIVNANEGIGFLPSLRPPQLACKIPTVSTQPSLSLGVICPLVSNPPGYLTIRDTAAIKLTVTNSGSCPANGVSILNRINIPSGAVIGNLVISNGGTVIFPNPVPILFTNTDLDIQWTGLTIAAKDTEMLTVTFSIIAAPVDTAFITNVNSGISQLSLTPVSCRFPIKSIKPPPLGREVNRSCLKLFSKQQNKLC